MGSIVKPLVLGGLTPGDPVSGSMQLAQGDVTGLDTFIGGPLPQQTADQKDQQDARAGKAGAVSNTSGELGIGGDFKLGVGGPNGSSLF